MVLYSTYYNKKKEHTPRWIHTYTKHRIVSKEWNIGLVVVIKVHFGSIKTHDPNLYFHVTDTTRGVVWWYIVFLLLLASRESQTSYGRHLSSCQRQPRRNIVRFCGRIQASCPTSVVQVQSPRREIVQYSNDGLKTERKRYEVQDTRQILVRLALYMSVSCTSDAVTVARSGILVFSHDNRWITLIPIQHRWTT